MKSHKLLTEVFVDGESAGFVVCSGDVLHELPFRKREGVVVRVIHTLAGHLSSAKLLSLFPRLK